ncbi:hypothetical protein HDA40_002051 [Hamadaea flava]|nr:hypothetical protein [Hamadaea flava]
MRASKSSIAALFAVRLGARRVSGKPLRVEAAKICVPITVIPQCIPPRGTQPDGAHLTSSRGTSVRISKAPLAPSLMRSYHLASGYESAHLRDGAQSP